ncbi:kinase-like domain, phloem protein 2-like protein [Tanacetum coccineum]
MVTGGFGRVYKAVLELLDSSNSSSNEGDFGLSKFHPADQSASTFYTSTIAGTYVYLDPEYQKDGKLSKKSDIYSFGVVLLEILTGRLAYDSVYTEENHKGNLKLSLEDIKSATKGFSQDNIIGHGDSGNVYKGVTHSTHGDNIIAAKRLDTKSGQGDAEVLTELATAKFMAELDILIEYKHKNVIGLLGYCDEEDEKIIVYEYASRGSLDMYLSDDSLMWVMRLKICIDIAIGLEFLHGTVSSPEMVIHRDISSSNILLFDEWKAKITGFGLSLVCPTNQNVDYVIDNVTGTIGYRDPLHSKTGFLTKESDIFSLGAVLFDILCGKLSSEKLDDEYLYLPFLAKQHYHVGKLDKRERRPTAHEVVIQLKKALEFQEDHEKWEPKLPKDYKEIIQMSKCPDDYFTIKKEDLYNIFSKGILLQQDKVKLMSFDDDRERNEMVSSTMFSNIGSCPHEWEYLPESRFGTVVKILDISDLNFEVKTRAQFFSPDVYGVYLVFKFCDSKQFTDKPMYVNLRYRNGHKSLHAYFATWRDEKWMMIKLNRFLNQNEDVVIEFLFESFSSYYSGDVAVYVEGIEFQAIENVEHEGNRKLIEVQEVLKSNINVDQVRQLPTDFKEIFKIDRNYEVLFWLGNIDGMKLLIVSAKAALYNVSNEHLFTSKSISQSRFQEVIEVLPQHIFHIKCTIKSQMLSTYTEYVCYLVFKLSDKHEGLDCPVNVRDVFHQENNKAEFLYFITPTPLNIHDITRVPKQREDGWMEIRLWKFYSNSEFKDDSLSMNMKFTSHEGPMSGLIVCGLEFRPL